MVFEDQSNSQTFNKMNNIEFPMQIGLIWVIIFTHELPLDHETLKKIKR